MPHYVMLMDYKASGLHAIGTDPSRLRDIERCLERWEAKVVDSFLLMGGHDRCVIVDAPDNFKAYRGVLEQELSSTVNTQILPAIDIKLFQDLMKRSLNIEGPHRWQIKWWAKIARLFFRYQTTNQFIWKFCKDRTITGKHHFRDIRGPCIVVGNHTSMADGMMVLYALPQRIRFNIYAGAAGDRWFIKRTDRKQLVFKPWYQSLAVGSFPIQRGGGSNALSYSHWLLEQGANLLIFPEGTRSTSRSMARFKHGVSILALEHNVPVVPCYLTGLDKVRPKGITTMSSAPVSASFLKPIRFEPGTSVPDATHMIYESLNDVHTAVKKEGPEAAFRASDQG